MTPKQLAEAILKHPDYTVTFRESDYRNKDDAMMNQLRDFTVDHRLKQIRCYTWC